MWEDQIHCFERSKYNLHKLNVHLYICLGTCAARFQKQLTKENTYNKILQIATQVALKLFDRLKKMHVLVKNQGFFI